MLLTLFIGLCFILAASVALNIFQYFEICYVQGEHYRLLDQMWQDEASLEYYKQELRKLETPIFQD